MSAHLRGWQPIPMPSGFTHLTQCSSSLSAEWPMTAKVVPSTVLPARAPCSASKVLRTATAPCLTWCVRCIPGPETCCLAPEALGPSSSISLVPVQPGTLHTERLQAHMCCRSTHRENRLHALLMLLAHNCERFLAQDASSLSSSVFQTTHTFHLGAAWRTHLLPLCSRRKPVPRPSHHTTAKMVNHSAMSSLLVSKKPAIRRVTCISWLTASTEYTSFIHAYTGLIHSVVISRSFL
jgi:hypothetical protein